MNKQAIVVSSEQLEAIFETWDRRWRESPEDFTNIVDHLTKGTPYSYGRACSIYFKKLREELFNND